MRIHKADLPWITTLGIAVILSLNVLLQTIFCKDTEISLRFSSRVSPDYKTFSPQALSVESVIREDNPALHFVLLGTIAGNSPIAFIYNSETQKHGVYRLIDSIESYKVVKIEPGKVILEKDGVKKELLLSKVRSKDESPIVRVGDSGTVVVNKTRLMGQALKVNELLTKIKILPLPDVATNKLQGFRIDNIPAGSIIEDAGVKSGDIIYSVQGKKLQSVQDAWQMLNAIQNQANFEVVLLRDNKPLTIKYEIKN